MWVNALSDPTYARKPVAASTLDQDLRSSMANGVIPAIVKLHFVVGKVVSKAEKRQKHDNNMAVTPQCLRTVCLGAGVPFLSPEVSQAAKLRESRSFVPGASAFARGNRETSRCKVHVCIAKASER